MGGGGFSMEMGLGLDDELLSATGAPRPRVMFVPTASGDSADYVARFHAAMDERAEATHVSLFRREHDDLAALCRRQHVIYVGGGNTANMIAIWRTHGFDRALRAAYEAGVILAGVSAGAVCWFEDGVTDSFGQPLRRLGDGLGWLRGAMVPHYRFEPARRPTTHALIEEGVWPHALAVDDGAAAVYVNEALAEVWSAEPGATAYRVQLVEGTITEETLVTVTVPRR